MVLHANPNNTAKKDTNKTNQTTSHSIAKEPETKGGDKKPLNAAQLAAVQELPPKHPQITPNTTYSELKDMVEDASKQKIEGRTLISDSKQEVLFSIEEDGHIITVYKSGFFAYQDDKGRVTARAVHNCSTMYFPDGNGKFTAVPESEYKDKEGNPLPFTVILEHFGERNIEDQENKKKNRKQAISTDGEINYKKVSPNHSGTKGQLDENLFSPDFADALCDLVSGEKQEESFVKKKLKALPAALDSLKPRQREMIDLTYLNKEKLTQKEIAERLGIPQSSVSITTQRALKNLKKYLGQ